MTRLERRDRASALLLALSVGACACSPPAPPPPATNRPVSTPVVAAPEGTPPADQSQWGYEGDAGPERWATLSPRFAVCGTGLAQSPIDIVKPVRNPPPDQKPRFAPTRLTLASPDQPPEVLNTGHTIQINAPAAGTLAIGEAKYQLVQYHLHSPSEHTVAGKPYPMEMHMVHMVQDGRLAVIAVFIEKGTHNAAFEPLLSNLPNEKGMTASYPVPLDVGMLLPKSSATIRYEGSLTTPPCTESVHWIVMTTPIHMSSAQIAKFTALVNNNSRPVQPLNARPIVSDVLRAESR